MKKSVKKDEKDKKTAIYPLRGIENAKCVAVSKMRAYHSSNFHFQFSIFHSPARAPWGLDLFCQVPYNPH
jgi:hypothetical protein